VVHIPFAPRDLASQIQRCLAPDRAASDKILFNVGALTVTVGSRPPAALTPREFQILSLLYRGAEHTATRTELFASVWSGVSVCNKVLDVHVSKLRKKLAGLGIGVSFVRPAAYRLDFGGTPQSAGGVGDASGEKLVALSG
jgi:DNA-binding response OmpR family regulator